jgi:hypothetical protein
MSIDKVQTPASLIRSFFGLLPGETATSGGPSGKGFMGEYKNLTDNDKAELATRIARAQGLTPDQVKGVEL